MIDAIQALFDAKIIKIRAGKRFPTLLDYALARRDAEFEHTLAHELADLPLFDDDAAPVPVVTNLDGSPSIDAPGPTLQDMMEAARAARAKRRAECTHPVPANDDDAEI